MSSELNPIIPANDAMLGDLPPDFELSWLDEIEEDIANIIREVLYASQEAGQWMGVSIMKIAIAAGNPGVMASPLTLPLVWAQGNAWNTSMIAANGAEELGLLHLLYGRAFPTPALVEKVRQA